MATKFFVDLSGDRGGWAILGGPFDTLEEALADFAGRPPDLTLRVRGPTDGRPKSRALIHAESYSGNRVRHLPPRNLS